MSVILYHKRPDGLYVADETLQYYSPRYNKNVFIEKGQVRDGASGAMDIRSTSWWVHDQLCADAVWGDGTPCTRVQAANVLYDILWEEGHYFRAHSWRAATYLFGCKAVRGNK